MPTPNFSELRKKLREERDRKKKVAEEQIDREYEADLKSLERVLALMGEQSESETRTVRRQIGPAEAVREAVEYMGTLEFTVGDVFNYIEKAYPNEGISRASVSSAISKIVRKTIEVVKESAGREPGVYRKKVGDPKPQNALEFKPKSLQHQ